MEHNKGLRIITRDDINVEMLMLKEFHTYTPKNKAIFEEFARILNMAIDHVNEKTYSKARIESELYLLKQHASELSTPSSDSLSVENAVREFEGAIFEILGRNMKND